MAKDAEDRALIGIEFRCRDKAERKPKSGSSFKNKVGEMAKNGKKNDKRPPLPALVVVNKATPSGSIRKAKRAAETVVERTRRDQRAPDPWAARRQSERRSTNGSGIGASQGRAVFAADGADGRSTTGATRASAQGNATIPELSSLFAVRVNALNSFGASQAPSGALRQTTTLGSLALKLLLRSQDPVIA